MSLSKPSPLISLCTSGVSTSGATFVRYSVWLPMLEKTGRLSLRVKALATNASSILMVEGNFSKCISLISEIFLRLSHDNCNLSKYSFPRPRPSIMLLMVLLPTVGGSTESLVTIHLLEILSTSKESVNLKPFALSKSRMRVTASVPPALADLCITSSMLFSL